MDFLSTVLGMFLVWTTTTFLVANALPPMGPPFAAVALPPAPMSAHELQAHAIAKSVNAANKGWKATVYPRFARMSPEERKAMHGLIISTEAEKKLMLTEMEEPVQETPIVVKAEDLPEEFDPREKWPKCKKVFDNIRDQSRCGDCWAVAAAGAFSDRLCIASDGKFQQSISSIDTASCAQRRFVFFHRDGCKGSRDLSPAWKYYQRHGVVTGDNFGSMEGCQPYPFPPSREATQDYKTPRCSSKCTNPEYTSDYKHDRTYLAKPIQLHTEYWHRMEHLIKQEVYVNGSIEVGFIVYEDFSYYQEGVYTRTSNEVEGGHAVRLIGWGVDKPSGMPYWLIANSWGPEWGENGYFRIRRGTNEAGIESMTDPFAGTPILK